MTIRKLKVASLNASNYERTSRIVSALLTGAVSILFAWILLAGSAANAQGTGRGNITGVVTDSSGAVVPGAHVDVTNIATNVTSTSITNRTGFFEIDSLDAATYKVTVTAPGFQKLVQSGVGLGASATLNLPLALKVGRSNEVVTVTADAPLLDTESGLNGQYLTTKQLQSLPVTGNNPMQFAEIAPGVQTAGGVSQTYSMDGTLGWNGVSKFGTTGVLNVNEFSIDGAANEGNQRGNAISLNTDQIGELRVDTTAFDPTIGHTMGVTTTETTKNGTNQLHGGVTQMYQNRRWAALPRFQALQYRHQQLIDGCTDGPSTSPTCKYDEDKYGWPGVHENLTTYGIGGPVFIPKVYNGQNKFFFFVSGINDIYTDVALTQATIPTVLERGGNFSDLPATTSVPAAYASACPGSVYYGQYQIYDPYSVSIVNGHPSRTPICGNILPSSRLLNPKMASLINGLLPTPSNTNLSNNYLYTIPEPQTFRQFTTREDYALSDKDRIFVRFTRQHYTKAQPGIAANGVDTQQAPKWIEIGSLGWNHVFSPTTNLDVTLGGSNYETNFNNFPGYSAYSPSSLGLPSYADDYAGSGQTLPMITFGGNTYTQGGSGANNSLFGQINNAPAFYRTANIRANLTHVQGRHTIRAGGEWRQQNYARGIQGNVNGIYNFDSTYDQQNDGSNNAFPTSNTGLSYAALLMGVQTTSTVNQQAPISVGTPYYAGYAGDTWRVTPKLTLMPGIRYEYELGPKEKHNYQVVEFDPNASLAISGAATTAYQATYASATPGQQAVLPIGITVQGGPVYAGVNGAPVRQWNNNYRVLPRIGFAYQIRPDTVIRGGYGLFFDTLNALEEPGTTDQTNFTASTSDSSSTNFGQNFATTAPPISNPFPSQNGNHFLPAAGAAAGNLSYIGTGPTIYDHNLVPARAQRLAVSVQHQIGQSLMVDVGWIGSWTTDVSSQSGGIGNQGGAPNVGNLNLAPTPASFFAGGNQPNVASNSLLSQQVPNPFNISNFSSLQTSNAAAYNQMSHAGQYTSSTISLGTLVRPYPYLGGLSEVRALGQSHFQELQVTVNKRMSNGLSLMVAYQQNYQYDRDYFANPYDTAMSWEPSNNSTPYRLTAEGVYELPFGRDKMWANSGWKSAIFGGFRVNGTYELEPGNLIQFSNSFYIGDIKSSDIQLKHPIYHTDIPNNSFYVQWFNPANVASTTFSGGTCSYTGTGFVTNASCQPNGYNVRAFPTRVNGVRQQSIDTVQANVQRDIRIREGINFQLRFDTYNLFNRQVLAAPQTSMTNPQFGQVTNTAGANGSGYVRWFDIQAHLSF
jgi:hypothetical protein